MKEVNSMNRAVFTLSVLILGGLVSACASLNVGMVNDTTKPGVIIDYQNQAGRDGYIFDIVVDGKEIGELWPGEIKGYKLTNGNHVIRFRPLGSAAGESKTIKFTVNNDRHYFKMIGSYHRYGEDYAFEPWKIASYDITLVEAPVLVRSSDARLLNTAIANSFNTVSRNIPANSKIAIVNIASDNNAESGFIMEELTLAFVNARQFTIVDRQTLNVIREEQNFQLSGEVSDEDIISIGRFTGADIVITGAVSGNGEMRRLRLRALDVQTAQILAMSAEKI
jgi:TolB-like protein